MPLTALLRRGLHLVLQPEAEWRAMTTETGGVGSAIRHALLFAGVGPLALMVGYGAFAAGALPVAGLTPLAPGSPMDGAIGAYVFPTLPWLALPAHAPDLAERVVAGLGFYATTLACLAAVALTMRLLAPWCGGRGDLAACLRVSVYGATPLLVAGVGLAWPALLPLLAVGAVHACYVIHAGACRLLGLSSSDAAMLLGLAALVLLGVLPVLGVAAAALAA